MKKPLSLNLWWTVLAVVANICLWARGAFDDLGFVPSPPEWSSNMALFLDVLGVAFVLAGAFLIAVFLWRRWKIFSG